MKFNTEEKKMIQQLVRYNWHTLETIGRFLSNTVFTKGSGQQLISIS